MAHSCFTYYVSTLYSTQVARPSGAQALKESDATQEASPAVVGAANPWLLAHIFCCVTPLRFCTEPPQCVAYPFLTYYLHFIHRWLDPGATLRESNASQEASPAVVGAALAVAQHFLLCKLSVFALSLPSLCVAYSLFTYYVSTLFTGQVAHTAAFSQSERASPPPLLH